MWLIKKLDSQTIYVEKYFKYSVIEEEIYTKITERTAEELEEH